MHSRPRNCLLLASFCPSDRKQGGNVCNKKSAVVLKQLKQYWVTECVHWPQLCSSKVQNPALLNKRWEVSTPPHPRHLTICNTSRAGEMGRRERERMRERERDYNNHTLHICVCISDVLLFILAWSWNLHKKTTNGSTQCHGTHCLWSRSHCWRSWLPESPFRHYQIKV